MKNSKLILVSLILLITWSCSVDEYSQDGEINPENKSLTKSYTNDSLEPTIKPNQIVIQFKKEGLGVEEKIDIRNKLEKKYHFIIDHIQTCDCDNDSIELWTIIISNPSFLGIEDLVKNLSNTDDDDEDVEGDYQFWFSINSEGLDGASISTIEDKVLDYNLDYAVNIAVLDTGIDYDYFPEKFLYNSKNTKGCTDEISGWDFVNHDNDPRDDHGHGTITSKIVTDVLDNASIPYQILPVKAFDDNGISSYFRVGCALKYIVKKQKKFIINASFGFYKISKQQILENIIDSASDRILVISSAGNKGINTDLPGNEHFPSSYEAHNLLTVGGHIGDFTTFPSYGMQHVNGFNIASDSNHGGTSIDIAAPFTHHIILKSSHTINIIARGTSFSAAYTTGRAAFVYYNNHVTPAQLKQEILDTGFNSQSFNGMIRNNKILVKGFFNNPTAQTPRQ
ncbi:S8 family serine peptidase [Aquimarina sp. AU474]|uniref:S8 family peptidase n=1 Tax=Aquimarina sp. AU474 TaxID=2108529 RepID=UPI000D686FD4|nr:S8 family serine peptidase [Aquimarina sp. AU474]